MHIRLALLQNHGSVRRGPGFCLDNQSLLWVTVLMKTVAVMFHLTKVESAARKFNFFTADHERPGPISAHLLRLVLSVEGA